MTKSTWEYEWSHRIDNGPKVGWHVFDPADVDAFGDIVSLHKTAYDNEETARLIAAAPELLAALVELAEEADRLGNALSKRGQGATVLGMKCRKARAAIAKAKASD